MMKTLTSDQVAAIVHQAVAETLAEVAAEQAAAHAQDNQAARRWYEAQLQEAEAYRAAVRSGRRLVAASPFCRVLKTGR